MNSKHCSRAITIGLFNTTVVSLLEERVLVCCLALTTFTAKSFSQVTINESGNSVVKIYYDRNTYTVSFNANSASGNMASQTFYYGVEQAIRTNLFEKSGYTFNGWATSSNGQVVYGNKETVSVDSDLTLYALWYYGITATASTVEDLNLSNLTDAFTVKVTGNYED